MIKNFLGNLSNSNPNANRGTLADSNAVVIIDGESIDLDVSTKNIKANFTTSVEITPDYLVKRAFTEGYSLTPKEGTYAPYVNSILRILANFGTAFNRGAVCQFEVDITTKVVKILGVVGADRKVDPTSIIVLVKDSSVQKNPTQPADQGAGHGDASPDTNLSNNAQ